MLSQCVVSLGILLAKYGYELGRKKSVYLGKRLVADLENQKRQNEYAPLGEVFRYLAEALPLCIFIA